MLQMKEPLVMDQAFRDILQHIDQCNDHFFITGKAGTGKSTLLQLFKKTTRKKTVVLSPTGISALNVEGQTIHSFFQFAPKLLVTSELFIIRRLVSVLKTVEIIIIDEISMVRADVMDAIDYSLRLHRNSPEPFGGVQMIFFGDLFQLPPVVSSVEEKQYFREVYSSPYFFSAKVFQKSFLQMIELTRVYRQNERSFIRLLDAIRTMQFDQDDLDSLNERFLPEEPIEEPYLTLCSVNTLANQINASRLAAIKEPSFYFTADVQRDFSEKMFPTDYRLELKKNAQVVLLRNDPEKRFFNGTLATVRDIGEDGIVIETGKEPGTKTKIELPRMTWENMRYRFVPGKNATIESEVIGTFTQYPVKLAWAVTIHKSQGKTYDRVVIDLGRGAFEHGQSYVALSRCRQLKGIYLKKPLTARDFMVDETVVDFYERNR